MVLECKKFKPGKFLFQIKSPWWNTDLFSSFTSYGLSFDNRDILHFLFILCPSQIENSPLPHLLSAFLFHLPTVIPPYGLYQMQNSAPSILTLVSVRHPNRICPVSITESEKNCSSVFAFRYFMPVFHRKDWNVFAKDHTQIEFFFPFPLFLNSTPSCFSSFLYLFVDASLWVMEYISSMGQWRY